MTKWSVPLLASILLIISTFTSQAVLANHGLRMATCTSLFIGNALTECLRTFGAPLPRGAALVTESDGVVDNTFGGDFLVPGITVTAQIRGPNAGLGGSMFTSTQRGASASDGGHCFPPTPNCRWVVVSVTNGVDLRPARQQCRSLLHKRSLDTPLSPPGPWS